MIRILLSRLKKTRTEACHLDLNWFYQTLDGKEDELKEEYLVPSLDDLGFDRRKLGAILYPGGETEALERMERNLKKTVCLKCALRSWRGHLTVNRVPTRPGKPGKIRVHLENLEISWNFEKFNKYHGKMPWNLEKLGGY